MAATPVGVSDTLWLGEAHKTADSLVQEWARAVLREIATQSIQQSLSSTVDADTKTSLHLSPFAVPAAQELCRRVSERWCQKLKEIGHMRVAEIISNVFENEHEDLFFVEHPDANNGTALDTKPAARPLNKTDTPQDCVTTLARLKRIGEHNVLAPEAPEVSLDDCIRQIDILGSQGLTDWPYSWQIIQQAAEQIPSRLHKTRKGKSEIDIIPKSVWEKEQGEHDPNEADEIILKRKRKSRQRLPPPKLASSTANSDYQDEVPRPADNSSDSQQWNWRTDILEFFSGEDRDQLNSCLHENATKFDANALALGALSDAGRYHNWNQQKVDQEDVSLKSDRQKSLDKRQSIKERLGDHKQEGDYGTGKSVRVSRVHQTIDGSGRHWLDLDLASCMFEIIDGDTRERKLFYFDILECMLLDEDKPV